MNQYVYLYELDSVRNQAKDVKYAHQCLYNEIVKKGNTVILSLNQLCDGLAIASLIKDTNTQSYLLQMFKEGSIKVSMYGSLRSPSQYVQQAIQKCLDNDNNRFIFSVLPLNKEDKELLQIMKECLMIADFTLLDEFIVTNQKYDQKTLDYIRNFLEVILMLSIHEKSQNPIKKEKSTSFTTYLKQILDDMQLEEYQEAKTLLLQHYDTIMHSDMDETSKNNRSNWYPYVFKDDTLLSKRQGALINLAYNYTIEDSIDQISKRKFDSFQEDVHQRLKELEPFIENVHDTSNDGILPYVNVEIDCQEMVRISTYHQEDEIQIGHYLEDNNKKWKRHIGLCILKRVLFVIGYILLFIGIESGINILQSWLELSIGNGWIQVFNVIVFGIVSSLITLFTHSPDVLDCFHQLGLFIHDYGKIIGKD